MHKGVGKKNTLQPKDAAYSDSNGDATLLDGLTGTTRHNDGMIQGFNSADLDVTIDMGRQDTIKSIRASFLQSVGTWIYLPEKVAISVSHDGQTWREVARAGHSFDPHKDQVVRHTFRIEIEPTSTRYVRVVSTNTKTPVGLPGTGTINWIFADEIFID